MNVKRLKLPPESDLKTSVEEFAVNAKSEGFILGVVGDLQKARFKCPMNDEISNLDGPLEIITLNGTVSPERVHLHLSVSDNSCHLWGGHLEEGSTILKAADLLIGLIDFNEDFKIIKTNKIIADNTTIEIAVLPSCPWSARILRMLKSSNYPYKVININNDKSFEKIRAKSHSSTFPQVFIDGKYIGGYDQFMHLFSSGRFTLYK